MILKYIDILKEFKYQKFIIFISNASALEEISSNFFHKRYRNKLFIIIGNFDITKIKNSSIFVLPYSDLYFKPYSFLNKVQVLFVDLSIIFLSITATLFWTNKKLVFTSILNCRPLYLLDFIGLKNIEVIEFQYEHVYKFLENIYKNRKFNFNYGKFKFRRSHCLKCKSFFPRSLNNQLDEKLNYEKQGLIVVLQNPRRGIKIWDKVINYLNESCNDKSILFLLHPITSSEDYKILETLINKKMGIKNFNIKYTRDFIQNEKNKIYVSKCITFNSSLDFIFFNNNIPIISIIN